jgi:SagB-type dehydrogenase family enzyme
LRPTKTGHGVSFEVADSCCEIVIEKDISAALLRSVLSNEIQTVEAVANRIREYLEDVTEEAVYSLLSVLIHGGVFVTGLTKAENMQTIWEFHDLLFHNRSTQVGGCNFRQGASYPLRGKIAPLPALRPCCDWPEFIELPRLQPRDLSISFWDVLQQRRSPPDGMESADTIHLVDLGYFLSMLEIRNSGVENGLYDTTRRLYAGAGACYELEFYLIIERCVGITPGLYYYNPGNHTLHLVAKWSHSLQTMSKRAESATGRIRSPAAIILISARFGRLAWKYEGIAYSLCLKDVGVVFSHMYLAGAALGVEVCGLGSVDGELFEQASGIDRLEEPLVAQFMVVGSRTSDLLTR